MQILVTGGAGFIGSHICQVMLNNKHDVTCLDNFDPYYDPELKRKNILSFISEDNFTLIEGDINDKSLIEKIKLNEYDYIFHLAAQAGVRISVENPLKPNNININGTLNILMAAKDSSIKKIIFASSSSVYGKTKYLPFDEEHPKTPVSPYGISKLAAEEYCRVFYELYGLRTTSLRYFTVYGPRMRPDLAISIFTQQALNNDPIQIFGTGDITRDFTYIDDVINANMLAMNKGDGRSYNIGSGMQININHLAEKIIKICRSNSKIVHKESQKGDAEHTWANVNKANKELNWKPEVSLEEGLKKYIKYIKSYRNPF